MHSPMIEPRVKGLAMVNVRNWFDERLGTGWCTSTAREVEPAWPERLLPGDWYSARTSFHIYARGFEQLGGYESQQHLMEVVSGDIALADLNGIMRAFLWAASPKMFLRTAPKIWDTYVNFSKSDVLSNEHGRFVARISDIPGDVITWVIAGWKGFLVPALELAGGKDPKVVISEIRQTKGADTWEFLFELTYS
jgi:hypothetical protein